MDMNLLELQVQAGNRAREYFSLLEEDHPHFWYTLHNLVAEKLPKQEVKTTQDMTYEQAIEFEREPMPFGKFKGMPVGSIRLEYLCSLLDPNPFVEKIRRYVRWRNKYDGE